MAQELEPAQKLGRWVRERRLLIDMTQGDLAAAIGREQRYISDLERGAMVNVPPLATLRELCVALHCSMSDLLAAAGYLDEPIHPDIKPRAMMWAQKTGNFSPEEDALVDMFLDQIRRAKGADADGDGG